MASGFGDEIQAVKVEILEVIDLLVINKADMPGASKLRFNLGREAAQSDRVLETEFCEFINAKRVLVLLTHPGCVSDDQYFVRPTAIEKF